MFRLRQKGITMALSMGNATIEHVKKIYNLECNLCSLTYKNPKVLPCLHSFCEECLQSIIRGHHQRTLTCPTCHAEIPIPTKGVDAYPSHSFINNMLNILAVQSPTHCTNCEDRAMADSRCLDCVENLCPSCVTAHERIRQTKDHKVVSFEELQNNAVHDALKCPSFCSVHDREILKYFCETCDDAICRDCAIYDHREHNYVDLKEAVKTHRSVITSLLDNSKRKIPIIKFSLNEVIDVTKSLTDRRNDVRDYITATVNQHIKTLEEKKTSLVDALEETFRGKEQVLREQRNDLEIDLECLLTSCDFVENVLRYGNEAEIMIVKRIILNRLNSLNDYVPQTEPEENDVLHFDPKDEFLKTSIDVLGSLSTSSSFPPLCIADGIGLQKAKVGHVTQFKVLLRDRFGEAIGEGGDPVTAKFQDSSSQVIIADVVDNGDGTYTVTYKPITKGDHSIIVYVREKHIYGSPFDVKVTAGIDIEKVGPMLLKFGSAGITGQNKGNDDYYEPWGVTTDQTGLIIVTDHNNHRIQTFDANGKFLYQFGSRGKGDGEMWYPAGVAVDNCNNIYIADHGNHRIQVFSHEGEFLRKFCTRGTAEGQLKAPCALAIDNLQRLVVADRDNHRIQLFDLDGNFTMQFGGYGNVDGKLNSPRHITVTSHNHVLVSDTNNYRIQRFDTNGLFVSKFGSKGTGEGQFMCASGIGVDSEGHIAVADFKNVNVQLFTLSGKYIKKLGIEGSNATGLFNKPSGLCISGDGNILVADRGTHRVQLF